MPISEKHCTLLEDSLLPYLEAVSDGSSCIARGIHDTRPVLSFPNIRERNVWESLNPALRALLIQDGESALAEPWQELLATDYLLYSRTGDRLKFETKYFSRRLKLTRLVLAECTENHGRFLDEIINGITLIGEETGWCLPPHNNHGRDLPTDPLQDITRPVVDLFAAETASLLGLTEQLLRPVLAKVCPFLCSNLDHLLRTRILLPYLREHFWWMGDGKQPMLNWTPWITQNILLSMFTRPKNFLSPDERERILRQAALSADYFLDEYADDGCCSEGTQYYSHAGLCLFGCMDLLNRLFPGSMTSAFRTTRIKNMADYILKMYAGDQYYINFADGSPHPGRRSARDYLFGKATGNESMAMFAAQDYADEWKQSEKHSTEQLPVSEQNLYYQLLRVFSHEEMLREAEKNIPIQIPDIFYESVGLMIARDTSFVLAAKAGCNADAHNHNDVGSVTVYKNSRPFLIDLGVETYTKKTFSSERYEIWTMQSQYHNLPTFFRENGAPVLQLPGQKYAARDVNCILDQDFCSLSMDLAPAYDCSEVQLYQRTVTLQKESGITISDRCQSSLPCVLSLITYEEPKITEVRKSSPDASNPLSVAGIQKKEPTSGEFLVKLGDLGSIRIQGASGVTAERLPVTDPRLQIAWKHDCFRVLVHMQDVSLTLDLL